MKWRFLVPLARRHVSGRPTRPVATSPRTPKRFSIENHFVLPPNLYHIPRRPIMQRGCFLSSPLPVSSRRIPLPPAQRLLNRRQTVTFPRKAKVSPSWRFVRGSRRQFPYGHRSQRQLRVYRRSQSDRLGVHRPPALLLPGRLFFFRIKSLCLVPSPRTFATPSSADPLSTLPPAPTHLLDAYRSAGLSLTLAPHFTQVAGIELSPDAIRFATHNSELDALAHEVSFRSGERRTDLQRTALVVGSPARVATRSCGGRLLRAQTIVL
ncbi:hypothetical protein EDB84DRAFT_1582392 [Lactarius hengduanensis]|nr:hypothetical protein EDB84DRAFT_1582392 [Lactarius hengduanensis]